MYIVYYSNIMYFLWPGSKLQNSLVVLSILRHSQYNIPEDVNFKLFSNIVFVEFRSIDLSI